jgi:hypothetical protein
VDFSNAGDMFAMGGGDGVIRVFNVTNEVWQLLLYLIHIYNFILLYH